MTSNRDDVKILQLQFRGIKGHGVVMFLVQITAQLQLAMIKLQNAITKETIKIFHSHLLDSLRFSLFKERKGFTETQAVVKKCTKKILVYHIFGS